MSFYTLPYLLSKVGHINISTRSKAIEIISAAQAHGHRVRFVWGMGSSSEHATGHALDIMVDDYAAGEWIRGYVWANRQRLRLHHVIWAQSITSTTVQPGVRRRMPNRGNSTENHFDHNHIYFFAGPYIPPTGKPKPVVSKPVPPTKPTVKVRVLRRGMKGQDVKNLQAGFNRVFPTYPGTNLKVDGDFGPATEANVIEFQRRTHLKMDGVVGPLTRAKLRQYGVRL